MTGEKRLLSIAVLAVLSATPGPSRAQPSATPKIEHIAITPALVVAAEREGQITVQYSHPLLRMQELAEAFNKAYPGVRLNLERKAGASGAAVLIQEVAAGVRRVDVFQGTEIAADRQLIDAGAIVAAEPANIAAIQKVALAFAPHMYSPDHSTDVIAYNPNAITPAQAEKLKSWSGILDPDFKGKLSIVEPTFGVTMAPLLYIMNTPGLGEAFLRKLKAQDPLIFTDTAQARDALVSGRRPISFGAEWLSSSLMEIGKGSPYRFVYPDPTVQWSGSAWGIMKAAPHPNAARLFWAWLLSEDAARADQGARGNADSNLIGLSDERAVMQQIKSASWYQEPKAIWTPSMDDWLRNGQKYQETWEEIMGR